MKLMQLRTITQIIRVLIPEGVGVGAGMKGFTPVARISSPTYPL
jgi:hypothetical protein